MACTQTAAVSEHVYDDNVGRLVGTRDTELSDRVLKEVHVLE